jgi:hypothetical protein
MASGLGWQLLARAPRHGTHVLVLPVADLARGNVDVGEIVLAPQAILEGRLVEEDGRPIAGASVTLSGHAADIGRLLPAGAHAAAPLYHFGHRQSRTAGDGAFRFAGLAAGSYSVRAELDGQDWEAKGGPYEVRDGQVLGVADVVVPGGLAIEGVVRVPGALRADQRIELTARGAQGSTRSALVGRDGSFRLERLAAGNYLLFASTVPEGFVLAPRRDVAAGTKGLELDLVPAAVLEGRVVDDAGEPVRGASIYFFPEGVPTARNVLSGADGRFRLEVPPGVRGKLGASHPDVMMRQVHMPDVEAPRSDLVLRLPK